MKLRFLGRALPARPIVVTLTLLAAVGVVAGREHPAPPSVALEQPARPPANEPAALDLAKVSRSHAGAPQSDPFAPRSFARAAPPAVAGAPAAPTAPPLPFSYFGRVTENGKTEVFLLRGDDLISIAAGQKIDAEWRVDKIEEARIGFTYLPLKTRQSLELGEASG